MTWHEEHTDAADRPDFVGRERELAALRATRDATRSGQARTVLLEGPTGIGKTALLEHFLATDEEARILRASGERWEALVPFGVIDQLLRSAGVSGTQLLATRERVLPPEEPASVGAYLLDVLGDLEQKAPVIVVVEDVHWADTDSLRALLFAARRLMSERVLTVLSVRDEASGRLPEGLLRLAQPPTGRTVSLTALTVPEIRRLATMVGAPEFSARAARRLQAHTQGNPLFVRALLAEMPADRWRTWEPQLPAPRAFAMQVERRLNATTPGTRRLVEAASALGARVPLSIAATLGDVDDPLAALDDAVLAGLLEVRDEPAIRDIAFPHP
ncbi:MAG: AAA family ATPase, partial [Pseudonocardia sp.]